MTLADVVTPDVERLAVALGPAARVAYAPPNIFPMSAPDFVPERSIRPRGPRGERLSIYLHVPFCNYHCNFCFYATFVRTPREQMERYVDAVVRELEWLEPGTRLSQLYVGGGTPTTLPPELLDRLLTTVFARTHGQDQPHTVERSHNAHQAVEACDRLVDAGLMVNTDLIYGLPGLTEEDFARDFATAVEHGVHTVTAYNLRVNERTPVAKAVADEERLELARLVRWRAVVSASAQQLNFVQTRWHTFRRLEGDSPAQALAEGFEDLTGQGEQFSAGLSARSRLDNVIYRNHRGFKQYVERIERGESPADEVFPLSEEGLKTRFLALSIGDGKALERAAYEERFG